MSRTVRLSVVMLFASVALVLSGCESTALDRSMVVAAINSARSADGKAALSENAGLSQKADFWAVRLRDIWAANGCSLTSIPDEYAAHLSDLSGYYLRGNRNGWRKVSERLISGAVPPDDHGAGIASVMGSFMASDPDYRSSVLGANSTVGVGVVYGPTATQAASCPGVAPYSQMFSVQVFVK